MSEKLQKVLARAGIGSRRELEDWIAAGRVSVDGSRAPLGTRVEGSEVIRVDGHIVPAWRLSGPRRRVLLYNKPERELCTHSDPEGRTTVFDRLPSAGGARWLSIGRLDYNTMGLLILTTDGELAHRISHPSFGIEREYAVRVLGNLPENALETLKKGVELEDGPAQFQRISDAGGEGANHWYNVVIGEGRNREVRRMFESVGVTVSRLIRVRYGTVELPRGLQRGRWQEMDPQWVRGLAESAGLSESQPEADKRGGRGNVHKKRSHGHSRPHSKAGEKDRAQGRGTDYRAGSGSGSGSGSGRGAGPGSGSGSGRGQSGNRGKPSRPAGGRGRGRGR